MTNQEIITAVEEWCEANEEYYFNEVPCLVETPSLITFIKKLLHE